MVTDLTLTVCLRSLSILKCKLYVTCKITGLLDFVCCLVSQTELVSETWSVSLFMWKDLEVRTWLRPVELISVLYLLLTEASSRLGLLTNSKSQLADLVLMDPAE